MPIARKDEVTNSVGGAKIQLTREASQEQQEEPGGGNEVEAVETRSNDFDLFDELGYDEFDSHYNDIIPPGFDDNDEEEEAGSGNTQQSAVVVGCSSSSVAARRQEDHDITSTTTSVSGGVAGDLARTLGTKRARSAEPAAATTTYSSITIGPFDEMWGRTQPSEGNLTNYSNPSSSSSSSSFLDEFKRCFPKAKIDLATPTIANIVSIMHLGVKVDLQILLNKLKNVEFNTGRKGNHSSITLRLEDPVRCVAVIRPTGTVLLLGATNMSDTRMAAEIVARVVRISLSNHYDGGGGEKVIVSRGESGISPPPTIQAVKYRVRCIMARFDLQHPIRLDELAHSNPSNITYEPSKTAGCQIKLKGYLSPVPKAEMVKGGTTIKDGSVGGRLGGTSFGVFCTVYQSGKVVMSGAHSVREVEEAFKMLIPLVAPFAKQ